MTLFRHCAFASLLLSIACVTDAPILTDGAPNDSGDGSMNEGGGGDGSDSGPSILSCNLAQQPGEEKLGDVTYAGDAGMPLRLDERFTIIPAGANSLAVAGFAQIPNGSGTILYLWAPIAADQNMPSPNPRPYQTMPGNRIIWIGRVTDGLGLLVYEQLAGKWGFTVYKVTDTDLNAGMMAPYTIRLSRRVDLMGTVDGAQDGVIVPIGVDDYFLVGVRSNQNGTNNFSTVVARMSGSPMQQETAVAPADKPQLFSLVKTGNDVHLFQATGNFPMFNASDVIYDANTAMMKMSVPFPNTLVFAAHAGPSGINIGSGDFTGGNINGVRVGTVQTPDPQSIGALKLTTLGTTELPFSSGSYAGWLTPQNHAPLMIAAGSAQPKGMNFLWFDSDGNMRSRQTVKTTPLLTDVNHIASVGFTTSGPFVDMLAQFPMAWVSRNDMTMQDTVYYGKILCGN